MDRDRYRSNVLDHEVIRRLLFWAVFALIMFVSFDYMMMLDQQRMCERGDTIPCPTGLWIWERL